jgi:hypothetical protein
MGITRGTETVRFDKATRLILEDMGKKRGTTWGQVARQLVNEGISKGFEIEEMAKGLETVGKTLEEVSAKNETLARAGKAVAENVQYLSKLQTLDKLDTLATTTQTVRRTLEQAEEDMQRISAKAHGIMDSYNDMNKMAHLVIGVFIGFFIFAVVYVVVLR